MLRRERAAPEDHFRSRFNGLPSVNQPRVTAAAGGSFRHSADWSTVARSFNLAPFAGEPVMRAFVVRAFVFAILSSCALVLGLWVIPAHAGGYGYGIGAYGPDYVWAGDGCCCRGYTGCCHRRLLQAPAVVYYRAGALFPGDCPRVIVRVVPRHGRVRFSEFDYHSRYGRYGHVGCYWKEASTRI
jgi:hypothetical protein